MSELNQTTYELSILQMEGIIEKLMTTLDLVSKLPKNERTDEALECLRQAVNQTEFARNELVCMETEHWNGH